MRIALVTGAARGLGRAVAEALAARGCHVIGTMRNVEAIGGVEAVPLDMRDGAGIAALATMIAARFGRLDVLAGNAGVLGKRGPLVAVAPGDWDEVLAVNFTANAALIAAFDPLLRQSDAGRAVFVTSGAAVAPDDRWGVYGISKAALNALVITWARELEGSTAKANLLRPGPVRTAMRAAAMPHEDPLTVPGAADVAAVIAGMCEATYALNGEIVRYRRPLPSSAVPV